jgi:LysM repeat protein
MAITNKKINLTVDLTGIVDNSIAVVKKVRASERSRMEYEFQKAVASGMSYDAQVEFRNKQLKDEMESSLHDPEYSNELETSIAKTKRLARFEKFRTKYSTSLSSLVSGKTTAQTQLSMLEDEYRNTTDPELKSEINGYIVQTQSELKSYNKNIIDNTVARAQKDGTIPIIEDAINLVKSKRVQAAINGNDEEVTNYDLQLTTLNSQKTKTEIEDALHNITVKSVTSGVTASEKLNTLNSQIAAADPLTPVTIDGKKYNSAKDYWSMIEGAYLSGAGSGVFGDFFSEIKSETKSLLTKSAQRDGYVHTNIMDSINDTYDTLAKKPEMALYTTQLENAKVQNLYDAVNSFSKALTERVSTPGSFSTADTTLIQLGKKYNIDVTDYRTDLAATIAQRFQANPNMVNSSDMATYKKLTGGEIGIPSMTNTENKTPEIINNGTSTASNTYDVKSGDTLSDIAVKNNTTVDELVKLNNIQDRNMINIGQKLNIPSATPTNTETIPVQTPTPAPTTPTPTTKPVPTQTIPTATPPVNIPSPVNAPMEENPVSYVIKSGDTLSSIAARNNTTVEQLASLNKIVDPNKILAGSTINIK